MIWLFLCALTYIGIFLAFKLIGEKKLPLVNCVIVNYVVATGLSCIISNGLSFGKIIESDWFGVGLILGFLFILAFIILGLCSQKSGIGVSAVASKMSLVIPMAFSIIMYNEKLTIAKIIAVLLALSAVFLSSYKPKSKQELHNKTRSRSSRWLIFLPVVLFIAMGVNDLLVVYAQQSLNAGSNPAMFTTVLFAISFLFGLFYLLVTRQGLKPFANVKVWLFGMLLGSFNFGSIYFVMQTMNSGILSVSAIYGICNTAAVLFSILIGRIFFGERLTQLNIFGGILALLTIILMAISR